MSLYTDIARIALDRPKLQNIVNGDATVTVATDGGTVPSLSRLLSQMGAGTIKGAWVTATSYVLGDVVTSSGTAYRCILAHTSAAAFATDLAASKWIVHYTATSTVDTMAALKAAANTYGTVMLLGYYAAGDGGGGKFRWNSADVTADNGGTVIQPSSLPASGRWNRQMDNGTEINVRAFGAKVDGATDDTTAAQAVLDFLYAAGGGSMLVPRGNMRVSSLALNWAASGISIQVRGEGKKATNISKIGATTTPVIDFSGTAPVQDPHMVIRDLRVLGLAKSGHGIRLTRLARMVLSNVACENCDVGLENVGGLIFQMYDCTMNNNNIGYRSRKSGVIYCNLIQVYGGEARGNPTLGFDIGESNGFHIFGTDIETNGTSTVTTTGGIRIRATCDDEIGFGQISLNGVWLESNLGTSLAVEGSSGIYFSSYDTHIVSSEAGRAINIGAVGMSLITNNVSGSVGDTWTIAALESTIIGGVVNTLADTSTFQNQIGLVVGVIGQVPNKVTRIEVGTGGILLPATTPIQPTTGFVGNARLARFQDNGAAGNFFQINQTNGAPGNAAACALSMGCSGTTARSINAGGTINASGADYAEYEFKRADCGVFAKGDVVGFDADGYLTDRFDDAVSFGIKSTAPCIVGGDAWFTEQEPKDEAEWPAFRERLEAARAKVDRIAYCGKVPANVTGAKPGWVIVAERTPSGEIRGVATTAAMAVETGRDVIGRVRSILPDGRALAVV